MEELINFEYPIFSINLVIFWINFIKFLKTYIKDTK